MRIPQRHLRRLVPVLAFAVLSTGSVGVGVTLTSAPGREEAGAPTSAPSTVARSVPAGTGPAQALATAAAAPSSPPADTAAAAEPPAQDQASPVSPVDVGPLNHLVSPDMLLRVGRTLTAAELAELRDLDNLSAMALVDVGSVETAGTPLRVLGVDPTEVRGWTPPPTAASDELWQALGRGELVLDLDRQQGFTDRLGTPVEVRAGAADQVRLGGLAVLGMGTTDALVSRPRARALGVAPDSGVLLATPGRSMASLTRAATRIFGDAVEVTVLRPARSDDSYRGRPRSYRELYQAASRTCSGLSWTVLAAIGQVESNHGRNAGVSSAGAEGPMQFLPSTWAYYKVDGDGDGVADINNPFDAVHGAAKYLCASGAGRGGQSLYDAIFAYNHADWYVKLVLDLSARYR